MKKSTLSTIVAGLSLIPLTFIGADLVNQGNLRRTYNASVSSDGAREETSDQPNRVLGYGTKVSRTSLNTIDVDDCIAVALYDEIPNEIIALGHYSASELATKYKSKPKILEKKISERAQDKVTNLINLVTQEHNKFYSNFKNLEYKKEMLDRGPILNAYIVGGYKPFAKELERQFKEKKIPVSIYLDNTGTNINSKNSKNVLAGKHNTLIIKEDNRYKRLKQATLVH